MRNKRFFPLFFVIYATVSLLTKVVYDQFFITDWTMGTIIGSSIALGLLIGWMQCHFIHNSQYTKNMYTSIVSKILAFGVLFILFISLSGLLGLFDIYVYHEWKHSLYSALLFLFIGDLITERIYRRYKITNGGDHG